MFNIFIIAVSAYLIGSFPTGVLVGKIFMGKDIRKFGSGNTGATNSFRVLGPLYGSIVAVIDFLKGFLAGAVLVNIRPFSFEGIPESVFFVTAVLFVVIGHVFPLFAGFKGGMGFNSAAGALTAWIPLLAPFCLAIFMCVLTLTGHVAVTASVTAFFLPICYLILAHFSERVLFDPVILAFFIFIFVLVLISVRKKVLIFLKGEAVLFEKVMLFKRRSKK